MTKDNKQGEFSLEEGLARLEAISRVIEGGECSLDDSVNLFEEGSSLYVQCRNKLRALQLRIEKINYEVDSGE